MSKRRVVITGLGLVTPVGNDVESSWKALLAGQSGIAPITKFDATEYGTRFSGSVKNFDIEQYLTKKDARKMDCSPAMRRGEYKHVSTVDPICILQLIVNTSGRRRNQIIKELSEKI